VDLLRRLEGRGAGLRCLTQPIDTTSPAGRLLLTMLGAVAEFERDLIRERTAEGLEAARRRGRKGGRPRLVHGPRVQAARQMHAEGRTPRHICAALQISRSTLYRWLAIEAA
jgi:DNA invertase Pin-like site-specific DNA recombinase